MNEATPAPYRDDDLVYVDPEKRVVVGRVEFSRSGSPRPLLMPYAATEGKEGRQRGGRRKRYYPWGTYRSMKSVYHLEGKPPKVQGNMPLEDAIARAQQEAYWN